MKKILQFPKKQNENINKNELVATVNEWKIAILTICEAIHTAPMTSDQFDDACLDLERSLENYREWKQALKQL